MATFVIARLTFREAAQRRVLLAAVVFGLLFLGVYGVGVSLILRSVTAEQGIESFILQEMRHFLLMAGLYAVHFLTVMMTVLTSIDTLSGEIGSGTIQTLLAKPIHRWEVVLGKWLGFAGMLTLYLVLMAGGVMGLVYAASGYAPQNVLQGVGLMWLNIILLLSLSLLGGATLSTLTNGVIAFGLFGMAFIGGWMGHVGTILENQAAVNVGFISSLILPSEALWRSAVYQMRSPIDSPIVGSPFSSPVDPGVMIVVYAVLYTVVVLGLTLQCFYRRDL